MYWQLDPEVPGELGSDASLDFSTHPPIVRKLHIEFMCWVGSDLCQAFPVYFVTTRLREAIEHRALTGCAFREMQQTKSIDFEIVYHEIQLLQFHWLDVVGNAGKDDFGLAPVSKLIVSQQALGLLQSFKLSFCGIVEWPR